MWKKPLNQAFKLLIISQIVLTNADFPHFNYKEVKDKKIHSEIDDYNSCWIDYTNILMAVMGKSNTRMLLYLLIWIKYIEIYLFVNYL